MLRIHDPIVDHPAYSDTVARYQLALLAWRNLSYEIILSFGLTRRAYCDAYLASTFHPFTWSATSTAGQEWTQAHADAAYKEAGK